MNKKTYPTISVCTLTHNEEKRIEQFLESLIGFADEIIISDTGSIDGTIGIVEKYLDNKDNKISLFHYKADEKNFHFGKAKNFAMSKCTKDYILVLDPDEIVSASFKDNVRDFLEKNKPYSVSIMRRDDWLSVMDEWIERIAKRESDVRHGEDYESIVHEHFVHNHPVLRFPYPVWHCQKDKHWLLRPHSRFNYLGWEIQRTPKTKSFFGHFLRGVWLFQYKFKKVYFRQGLRREGAQGLRYSLLRAFFDFLIQIFVGIKQEDVKYWETKEYKDKVK